MVTLSLMLDDAYAKPGWRSPLSLMRGPLIGVALALVSQSVPAWVMIYGCAMSLLLSSAVRLLFPPVTDQLQGVHAPALWLKRTGEPLNINRVVAAVVVVLLAAWIAHQVWK
jgi:hypothetical protein